MKALFGPRAKRYRCADLFAAVFAEIWSIILRMRVKFPDQEMTHRRVGSFALSGAVLHCARKPRQKLAQFFLNRASFVCKWVSIWFARHT
ncbi:MAG: hypothetical protein Q8O37_05510 [Sulfuricellaceae bacterium]|nr:hypothetical protein [Sulfuricellaceae bacterium]